MNLSAVPARAMALLASDTRIAPFAPFLVEDGVSNYSVEVDKALNARGACLLLADVMGGKVDPSDVAMATIVMLPIFIFDAPGKAHEPSGLDLIQAVIEALTSRHEFRLLEFGQFKNEKGGVLTICEFNCTVVFNR